MLKLLVFGTGNFCKKYMHLFSNCEIVAYLDNDKSKWGKRINEVEIIAPAKIRDLYFDYVALMSSNCREMRKQLLEFGVNEEKILDREKRGIFSNWFAVENYLFSEEVMKKERVLVISHALDKTGAPVVTCRLAEVLKSNGYDVTVLAEKDSNVSHQELLGEMLRKNISVILAAEYNESLIDYYKDKFDFFFVSTVVLYKMVSILTNTGKAVYWWLHEADNFYYSIDKKKIPCAKNLYVLPVGWIAHNAFLKGIGQEVYRDLLYGIPDLLSPDECVRTENREYVVYGMAAAFSERKGIDFLLSIIQENEQRWCNRTMFLFAGVFPQKVIDQIDSILCARYVGALNSKEMYEFYDSIDVLLCPSKFDPMPVVVSEAMQHKKVCVVSDMVGQSKFISHMQNGLVFESENRIELIRCIDWIINNKDNLYLLADRAYTIYEKNFSMRKFEDNLIKILNDTKFNNLHEKN